MATRARFKERKQQRREEAQARAEARAKRTDTQQLQRLVKAGHGHCKEAKRLRREKDNDK